MPSPRLRRGLAAALVAVAALPALSGCASGFDSPVLQDYNPALGVNVRENDVWAMNMLVVMPDSGRGTLVGALLNKAPGTDRLVEARVESEQGEPEVTSQLVESSLSLPSGRLVELSDPTTVLVEGDAEPGAFLQLTLSFEHGQQVRAQIPVVSPEGAYEDVPLP